MPKVYGGVNTSVSWKGIDLAMSFTYKIGGSLYDGAYMDVADDGYYWERIHAKNYYDNLWTPSNPDGTEPRIEGVDLTDAQQYSSRHVHNASYLRLKTLSLGYTLPKQWTRKASISSARLFFNGSNLWTIARYKDADPEVSEYGTRGWETPLGKTNEEFSRMQCMEVTEMKVRHNAVVTEFSSSREGNRITTIHH